MGGAAWRAAADTQGGPHLEVELRQRLSDVDLICEADPPVELVDAAEHECRAQFAARAVSRLAERSPATLATYIAIRGAERYEGIALWPQLGVTDIPSWQVGQAFLKALRRLGLPDFQQMVRHERARTYVAPILIHGGIPLNTPTAWSAASRSSSAAASPTGQRRSAASPLTPRGSAGRRPGCCVRPGVLRRTARCADRPDHGRQDGVVADRDTPPPASRHRARRPAWTTGLSRLPTPYVELDDWAGYGPTIVSPDGAATWTVVQDDVSFNLGAGESADVYPCARLSVQSAGQRRALWNCPVVWFTDAGRLVTPDSALPRIATALVPLRWTLRTDAGDTLPIVREGAALTGAWSRHHAVTVELVRQPALDVLSAVVGVG